MTVFELFRRLKPLYGAKIDRLWIEYQLADVGHRREIEQLVTLLAIKHLGMMIGEPRLVLDAPPSWLIGNGSYVIGNVKYPGLAPYPFRLAKQELLRHLFVLGPTGTGKSTLLIGLLRQFLERRLPFMVFDFKRNYRCLLTVKPAELVVFTVGRRHAPLRVNALTPPPGVEFAEWSEALADAICTSHLLMQGARNVLKHALLQAYDAYPDATLIQVLALLRAELTSARVSSRRYAWLESATRSVEELATGGFGEALCTPSRAPITELLDRAVIFELHGFGDDQKRFFCLYTLQAILLLRKNSSAMREALQHVLVFDEAHNIFPRERPGELSVPARLAREIREYGEAIIAATQQADVSESLLANTGIKLILRCDYPRDVHFASQLLQIEPKWLPKLELGTGIARLPVRYYQPFLFTFVEQPIKNLTVTDATVRDRWQTRAPPIPRYRRPTVTDREEALLRDIGNHPIAPITQRYARLAWNPKTGNAIKDCLISNGLARFDPITTPTGIVKILSLTEHGRAHLASRGVEVARSRHGGAEHEYWKHTVRKLLESHGYHVDEEYPIGNGKTVDLHATRASDTLWIEIETGRSDIKANVEKCAHLPGRTLLFFTSRQVLAENQTLLAAHPHLTTLLPEQLNDWQ